MPCLIDTNVASRVNKGTNAGLKYYFSFTRICNIKFGDYYILKGDVKKFFASISHDRLKEKLKRRIKDEKALKIAFALFRVILSLIIHIKQTLAISSKLC